MPVKVFQAIIVVRKNRARMVDRRHQYTTTHGRGGTASHSGSKNIGPGTFVLWSEIDSKLGN